MRRRNRRHSRLPVWIALILILLAALAVYAVGTAALPAAVTGQGTGANIDIGSLSSQTAILLGPDGQVLMDRDSDTRIYPASLTKIMTAVVALEALEDLHQPVTLSGEMFDYLYAEGAALAGFLPGETVAAIDLLYGAMLPSGAECAIGLAEHISGSESAFVERMNDKAAALGLTGTRFQNATGLHHPDHYSTAADIARLLQYALEDETFTALLTAGSHSTGATDLHPDGITFYSTLLTRVDTTEISGGVTLLGGKTGYTSVAGQCLASVAEYNGGRYVLVTTGAEGAPDGEPCHIQDAVAVYGQLQYL